MERVGHAMLSAEHPDVNYTVIAAEGLDELPATVNKVHLWLPARPAFARIVWFYLRSRTLVKRHRRDVDVVHGCGAVTSQPVDVATVHLCQVAVTRDASRELRGWRRGNTAAARYFGRRIERRQFRPGRVGVVAAVSPVIEHQLAEHYPDLERVVIPNGVDVQRFRREHQAKEQGQDLVAVMVTGDFALKGVDLALQALVCSPGIHLRIAGGGPIAHYRGEAHRLGVSERVEFLGFRNDLRDLYALSDVVVCVSHYESFGLYMVEAALAGCAVVANAVGVAPLLIGDNEGGVLIERTPDALSKALLDLHGDRLRTTQLGQRARERAMEFSMERMNDRYHDLYRSLFERAKATTT